MLRSHGGSYKTLGDAIAGTAVELRDEITALREKVTELEGSIGSLSNYLASIGETLRPTSLPVGRIIRRHSQMIDRATAAESRVKELEEALKECVDCYECCCASDDDGAVFCECGRCKADKALTGGEGS